MNKHFQLPMFSDISNTEYVLLIIRQDLLLSILD